MNIEVYRYIYSLFTFKHWTKNILTCNHKYWYTHMCLCMNKHTHTLTHLETAIEHIQTHTNKHAMEGCTHINSSCNEHNSNSLAVMKCCLEYLNMFFGISTATTLFWCVEFYWKLLFKSTKTLFHSSAKIHS